MTCVPIFSRIVSLYAEKNDLQFAVPGGLIGVGTHIDPTLTRSDRLVGQVLGLKGSLPHVFTELEINFYLLKRLLGVKTQEGSKASKVQKLSKAEVLMVNIGSTATGGKVLAVKQDLAKILLTVPVCTQEERRSLSVVVLTSTGASSAGDRSAVAAGSRSPTRNRYIPRPAHLVSPQRKASYRARRRIGSQERIRWRWKRECGVCSSCSMVIPVSCIAFLVVGKVYFESLDINQLNYHWVY